MRPRIVQADDQIGFYWATPTGTPTSLQALVIEDDEPERLVATHLEALDDALIIAAGVAALIAIVSLRERSLLVWIVLVVGALAALFAGGELLSPH